MSPLDRSLTISFGAVVLALMMVFLVVATVLSFQMEDRRQTFLATTLAESVSESVNRVNAYQMQDLVHQLAQQIPGLGYVAVVDREGLILAHSQTQFQGSTLVEAGMRVGDQPDCVWQGQHYLQLARPLLGGLLQGPVGIILVGISLEGMIRDNQLFLSTLIGLSFVGTLAAMGAVLLLSRRFGGRVQTLATQLQGILDQAPVGIAVFDHDGSPLQMSRAFAPLARSGVATFPGMLVARLNPDDGQRFLAQTARVRETKTEAMGDWTFGEETWHLSQFPLGRGHLGLIAQNLTSRVAIERELFESRYRLDQILEKSPVGIGVVDIATGRILRVNERFQKAYGYTAEALGYLDRWFELAHPNRDARQVSEERWYRALSDPAAAGAFPEPNAITITCADGTLRDVDISTAFVGGLAVVTFVDRTSEKAAERALVEVNLSLEEKVRTRTQELELTYRELVDTEKLAALGQLAAGMAHELNTPLAAIQAASRHLTGDLMDPTHHRVHLLASFQPEDVELLLRLSDRNQALARKSFLGPHRTQRRAMVAAMTAQELAPDEDLAEYLAELETDPEFLRQLASDPLKIRVVQLARDELALFRTNQVIAEAVEKATHVVDALRSYLNRGEEGELHQFFLADQLETILTLFQHKIRASVEVVRNFEPETCIIGDRHRLNQVWMNLINNALQAMDFQGRLSLGIRREAGRVIVEVGDSGPGIDPDIQDRIFTPYFTTKKPGEGLGLGLDLCRKIVRTHHGTIDFETRPGETIFRVSLPGGSSLL